MPEPLAGQFPTGGGIKGQAALPPCGASWSWASTGCPILLLRGPQEEGRRPTGSEQLHVLCNGPACGPARNRDTPQGLAFLSRLETVAALVELTARF